MNFLIELSKKYSKFIKYGLVSVVSYILIIVSIYLLVDVLKLKPQISYALVYLFVYIYSYVASIKFVFEVDHNNKKITKFIIATILFWFLGTLMYSILIQLSVHHLMAVVINAIIFMPVKYIINKNIVYK